jgi:hypothetical protein
VLIGVLAGVLIGCDDDEEPMIQNLGGVWSGTLEKLPGVWCPLNIEPLAATHTIRIDGDNVTVIDQNSRTFTGKADSATSFSVSYANVIGETTENDDIRYTEIVNGTAQVEVRHRNFTRNVGMDCTWKGQMTRS